MVSKDKPIKEKLRNAILLTSISVLFLTCSAYFVYEYLTFRQTTIRELSMLGKIIAKNSTAALAFDGQDEAYEILASLDVNPYIVAACLYNDKGVLFSHYPEELSANDFPTTVEGETYRFVSSYLIGFEPIVQGDNYLGTLYLRSNLEPIYVRFQRYAAIALLVIILSLLLVYFLSNKMQRIITGPILALAGTAQTISKDQDYSIRAIKYGNDEIGSLTDAFNLMIGRIQKQNQELQANEERYHATLDNMLEGCQIIGSDWRYIYINDAASGHNRRPAEELMGNKYMDMWPGIEATKIFDLIKHSLEDGINQRMENEFIFPDGQSGWFDLSIQPIPEGVFILSQDITERKMVEDKIMLLYDELELKVIERTAQLEEVNKELESFSYSVSHDLRAPLRAIAGYSRILIEDYEEKLDSEGHRILNVISRNTTKMGHLIDDLLTFSRIGKQSLNKVKLNMHLITTDVMEELRTQLNSHSDVTIYPLHEAEGDKSMIKQVITNLVSNAMKYSMKKKESIIEIGSYYHNSSIVYYFKDNGAGFDMKYYDKLFGVFQRLHSETEFEGTGVGLALVHRIITKHGGELWAEGETDKGAVFYFSLPTLNSNEETNKNQINS